jgi:hypothetical protein
MRDGAEPITVQTTNRDLVLWDKTRIKHKWPKFDEAPSLWLTFISWAAARRTGAIDTSVRYEDWESSVLDIDGKTDDDDEDMGAPFPVAPEPD